jgi:hypothetical protein
MKHLECIITGCRLIDRGANRHAWGDLHELGVRTLIFNAVLREGETAWEYGTDPMRLPLGEKRVEILEGEMYFERRGVIVLDLSSVQYNGEAARHILKGDLAARKARQEPPG